MKEPYDIKGSIAHIDISNLQGGSMLLVKKDRVEKVKGEGVEGKKMTLFRIVFLFLKCVGLKQFTHKDVIDLLSCGKRQAITYIRLAEQLGYIHRVKARPAVYRVIKIPESIEEMSKKMEELEEKEDHDGGS